MSSALGGRRCSNRISVSVGFVSVGSDEAAQRLGYLLRYSLHLHVDAPRHCIRLGSWCNICLILNTVS